MRSVFLTFFWMLLVVGPAVAAGDYLSDLSAQWFYSLPEDTRYRVQADLVMTGDYDALVDGKFGPSTFAALKKFQSRRADYPNGYLSPGSLQQLDEDANEAFGKLGMKLVSDERSGVSLYLPSTILTQRRNIDGGTSFQSDDGSFAIVTTKQSRTGRDLAGLWGEVAHPTGSRTVTYSAVSDGHMVVSGQVNGSYYYAYYFIDGDQFLSYAAYWNDAYADVGRKSAIFAASYALPTRELPSPATEAPSSPQTASTTVESLFKGNEGDRFGAFLLPDSDPDVVALDGDIDENAPLDFIRALKRRPAAKRVLLNSDGGYVTPGLLVANEVHIRKLETSVPRGAGCYSACAFIYFAGMPRTDEGNLGVHQIYGDKVTPEATQFTLSDVLDALQEFGVRQEVISIMLRTPPSSIHTFTKKEIADFGINSVPAVSTGKVSAIDPASVPGAQALLLEAQDNGTTGAVPFSGTLSWRRGTDTHGEATLLGSASIPARNLSVEVVIRKNDDPALTATHLMEVKFKVGDDFVGGSVAGLPGVLLKQEELTQGTPLVGASARVVGNQFIFALSDAPKDKETNLELLRQSKWMDLALIYASGKRAIVTLEIDPAARILFAANFAGDGSAEPVPSDDTAAGEAAANLAAEAVKKAAAAEAAKQAAGAASDWSVSSPLDLGM